MPGDERARLVDRLQRCNAAPASADDTRCEPVLVDVHHADQHLAAYGTLAPGGSNHALVADLGGRWQSGTVRGRRAVRAFPVFTWDERAAAVSVWLLRAAGLAARWPQLDAFEGADYRRILVPVDLDTGEVVVANLYAAVVPVPEQN